MTGALNPAAGKSAGLLESAIFKLFTRSAQVLDIEDVGSAFRILTLGGDAMRDVAWTPGDKIQLQLGGWVQRTYTPMDWDSVAGRVRILVYLHAGGPGAQWARGVRVGDACVVFGPRKSLRLARAPEAVILFGDETSFGLAAALSNQEEAPALYGVFEVATLAGAAPIIKRLRLAGAHVSERREGEMHFGEIEAQMTALLQAHPAADIVLTGKASAIQQVSGVLRRHAIGAARRHTKAYWAAGKTGLD
jgi:NADPH-dependent ferric siderophore reductase